MSNADKQQGHWLLAKMGKKVLRPGGKELTEKLINELKINKTDDVVEFAPGFGLTAQMTLKHKPKSYTGVELDNKASGILRKKINKKNQQIINANANATGLADARYSKVYGEAMLTMQSEKHKLKIMQEAHRILKKGGLYGIHELSLIPENLNEDSKIEIQQALARTIKVNARPLTIKEWSALLEKTGFEIIAINSNTMYLLEKKRVLADEGLLGTAKIAFNLLTHPKERKRILAMRKVFRQYQQNLGAVSIIACKR